VTTTSGLEPGSSRAFRTLPEHGRILHARLVVRGTERGRLVDQHDGYHVLDADSGISRLSTTEPGLIRTTTSFIWCASKGCFLSLISELDLDERQVCLERSM
jgi:hypothetical protein